jgi:hypothetical protein
VNEDDMETNNVRATNATIQAEVIALRERLDLLWKNHEREHTQHEAAHAREHAFAQDALEKAALLAKENKADANEWRASMTDREARFATGADVTAMIDRLDKIERAGLVAAEREQNRARAEAEERRTMDAKQSRGQWTVGLVVGVLATFGAVAVNTILRLAGS